MTWQPSPKNLRDARRRELAQALREFCQANTGYVPASWVHHLTGVSKSTISAAVAAGRVRVARFVFPDGHVVALVSLYDAARLDVYAGPLGTVAQRRRRQDVPKPKTTAPRGRDPGGVVQAGLTFWPNMGDCQAVATHHQRHDRPDAHGHTVGRHATGRTEAHGVSVNCPETKALAGLPGNAIRVLLKLCELADVHGIISKTQREIADAMEMDEGSTRRALRALTAAQLLATDRAYRASNVYRLLHVARAQRDGRQEPAGAIARGVGDLNARTGSPAAAAAVDAPPALRIAGSERDSADELTGPRIPDMLPEIGDSPAYAGFFRAQNQGSRARAEAPGARAEANSVPPPLSPPAWNSGIQRQQGRPGDHAARPEATDEESARGFARTWLGSLPTVTRAAWDGLSRTQKELVRELRDRAAAAEIRGTHPAEPGYDQAVDDLHERHHIGRDMAALIVYLADAPAITAAVTEATEKRAHRYPNGVPGAAIMAAVCQDWADHMAKRAQQAKRAAAQRVRDEQQRQRAAAEAARLDEELARARVKLEALAPLSQSQIRRLIDRGAAALDATARAQIGYLCGAQLRAGRTLQESPRLRDLAHAQLTTSPDTAAACATVAAG